MEMVRWRCRLQSSIIKSQRLVGILKCASDSREANNRLQEKWIDIEMTPPWLVPWLLIIKSKADSSVYNSIVQEHLDVSIRIIDNINQPIMKFDGDWLKCYAIVESASHWLIGNEANTMQMKSPPQSAASAVTNRLVKYRYLHWQWRILLC